MLPNPLLAASHRLVMLMVMLLMPWLLHAVVRVVLGVVIYTST